MAADFTFISSLALAICSPIVAIGIKAYLNKLRKNTERDVTQEIERTNRFLRLSWIIFGVSVLLTVVLGIRMRKGAHFLAYIRQEYRIYRKRNIRYS
jgi:hypothetical protein